MAERAFQSPADGTVRGIGLLQRRIEQIDLSDRIPGALDVYRDERLSQAHRWIEKPFQDDVSLVRQLRIQHLVPPVTPTFLRKPACCLGKHPSSEIGDRTNVLEVE